MFKRQRLSNKVDWISISECLPSSNKLGSSQEVLVVVSGFQNEYMNSPYEVARVTLGAYHAQAEQWLVHLHDAGGGRPVVTHWAEKPELPPTQMELFGNDQ